MRKNRISVHLLQSNSALSDRDYLLVEDSEHRGNDLNQSEGLLTGTEAITRREVFGTKQMEL